VVVGLGALLLLLVVFRSLVIPIQAAVMNLLSIGTALAVTVGVFQHGWLDGLLGVDKGPIESWLPVMLFAIAFGLSMDYEASWSRGSTRSGRSAATPRGRWSKPSPRPGA
jgi:RND superfamily putative drug exporter